MAKIKQTKTDTKQTKTKTSAAKTEKKTKTYDSFKALLSAKTKKSLPRPTTASIDRGLVKFTGKGTTLFSVNLNEFAAGQLVKLGFTVEAPAP